MVDYIGGPYLPRQRHVCCFFESRGIGKDFRNSSPCLLIHGGYHNNTVFIIENIK